MNAMLFANSFFGAGPGALIAKATAVLLVATLATLLLPRASAAMRHLVWLAALAGCASLAVLSPVAPPLVVPLPALDDRPVFINQVAPQAIAVRENGVVSVESYAGRPARASRALARSSMVRRSSSAIGIARYARTLFVAIWIIGCFVVLGRCILGHIAIARLIRRARPLAFPVWDESLDATLVDAGARRRVDLLISDDLSAPVTTGFIHPVILLPTSAESWPDERRRVVLVHEVAHIVRFDYAAQLVATLAGALFWFHPLAWFAAARLRAEAENAADDRVLAGGTAGVAYAGHLLELARMGSGVPFDPAVAVGMVRASTLERRFRAMLDTTRSRAALPRRLPAVATSLTLAAMIPLAGTRTTIVPIAHAQRVVAVDRDAVTLVSTTSASVTTISVGEPVASVIASPAMADTTIDKTIDATGGGRLTLDLDAGGSVIVRGWDEPHIRMHATLGGRDWRGVRVTLEATKGGARLQSAFSEATRSWSTDNAFELWVPRHMDIELSSAGGSLAISDLTGEFRGHTGGGAITIEGASGTATLATGGGDVSVTNSTLGGTVSTGGGGVYIANVTGGLTGSSGSGPVISNGSGSSEGWRSSVGYSRATTVSGGVGGSTSVSTTTSLGTSDGIRGGVGVGRGIGYDTVRVFGSGTTVTNGSTNTVGSGSTVETTMRYTDVRGGVVRSGVGALTYTRPGGDVVLDEMPNGGRVTTGGGRIHIGSSGGLVNVSTGGGDVDLAHMGGDATVWTGAGTVTITVVNTDGTEHSIDVSSGTGRVVLDLPRDLDATIELESAYTENLGHKTSIESELALTQSETPTWDDHDGTPRKYVRARGTVGNGRGLIRVRTVNGDILVRRR